MDKPDNNQQILLAEDDKDDVLLFEIAIESLPFAVLLTVAEDGERLMALLESIFPDIIFLDIHMPCKSGRECIQEIRANPRFDSIPVIMYTSFKFEEYIDETYRNGANFYMIKPNNIDALAKKIKILLEMDWKNYMYYPPKELYVIA